MEEFVEDAVYELGGMGAAESFGQLDGFVNGGAIGGVGIEDLVGAEAEDVSVGGGHPREAPVVGGFGEELVELALVATDAEDQRHAEFFEVRIVEAAVDEGFHVGNGGARIHIVLEEDLEGDFASSAAAGHGGG